MASLLRPKYIASLTFRGFAMPPSEVERLVGRPANEVGLAGEPRKPETVSLKRSFASWTIEFDDSTRLDEAVPALIDSLGGAEHLTSVRRSVKPEFLEVDIAMWIKDSVDSEGGFIDAPSIEMLAMIGATLSFGFYSRHVD